MERTLYERMFVQILDVSLEELEAAKQPTTKTTQPTETESAFLRHVHNPLLEEVERHPERAEGHDQERAHRCSAAMVASD